MRTALALAAFAVLATACAVEPSAPEEGTTESPLASKKSRAIDVVAEATSRSVGTPTYGYDPRGTFLEVEVSVDDRALREEHPGFDGLERAFALVTVADGATERTVRIELPFLHGRRTGYYAERTLDVHGTTLRNDALVVSRGVAVGLETNVGTIWAQERGDDFPIVRR